MHHLLTVIKYRFSCCKSTLSLFCTCSREISAKLTEKLKVDYFRLKGNTTHHRKNEIIMIYTKCGARAYANCIVVHAV